MTKALATAIPNTPIRYLGFLFFSKKINNGTTKITIPNREFAKKQTSIPAKRSQIFLQFRKNAIITKMPAERGP